MSWRREVTGGLSLALGLVLASACDGEKPARSPEDMAGIPDASTYDEDAALKELEIFGGAAGDGEDD